MSSRAILSYGLYVVPFAFVVGLSLQEWQLAQRVRAMEDGQGGCRDGRLWHTLPS